MHQFTFPPTVHAGSLFSTSLPALVIGCLFYNNHSDRCEVVSHSFYFHFPDDVDLFMYLLAISTSFLWKCLFRSKVQIFCPSFIGSFLECWIEWVLSLFWILAPYQIYCSQFKSVLILIYPSHISFLGSDLQRPRTLSLFKWHLAAQGDFLPSIWRACGSWARKSSREKHSQSLY